jgi:hypothetical protein
MQLLLALKDLFAARSLVSLAVLLATFVPTTIGARPYVEFDFARSAECRDVTTSERAEKYPRERLIELTLPVSVRFRGVSAEDVEELDIEINGRAARLTVFDFAPDTTLASDVECAIETTTTVKKDRSLDGSLGGTIPVPVADAVAHITPSINAGISRGETATEKMRRLPPKYAVVVSGTSSEGRGVFFKLKRSSQTSLEGVHELAVTFVAPAHWKGGKVAVGCSARGSRKVFWMDKTATLGWAASDVELYMAGSTASSEAIRYRVAKPPIDTPRRTSLMEEFTTEVAGLVGASPSENEN